MINKGILKDKKKNIFFLAILITLSLAILLSNLSLSTVNTEVCILDIVNGSDDDIPIVRESPVLILTEFKARPVSDIERLTDYSTYLTKEGGFPILLWGGENMNMIFINPWTHSISVTEGTWTVTSEATVRNVGTYSNSITFIVDFSIPDTTTTTTTTTITTTTFTPITTVVNGTTTIITEEIEYLDRQATGFGLLFVLIPIILVFKRRKNTNDKKTI